MLRTFRSSEAPASATDLRLAARTAAGTPIGSSAPKALEAVSVITSWPNRQGMTDLLKSGRVLTHVGILVLQEALPA